MSFISSRHLLAIACCALPLAATAQASHSIQHLDRIVITPSRSPELLGDAVGDVTVVSKQDLERAGQTSIAEILSKQPGVQFDSQGGPQTQTGISIRGTKPNQTLVLIDGVRVNSSLQGSVHWNTIDPATIERIEIVRGAASSLYGSDAIGGVINIITAGHGGDRPLSAWGNIGYGTHNTVKSSAGLSGAENGWDYRFSMASASSDGFDATDANYPFGRDTDKDGYRQHSVSGALGYTFAPGHSLRFTLYNSYIDADYDVGARAPGDPGAVAKTRQQAYTLSSTNRITADWTSTVTLGLSKDEYDDRMFGTLFSDIQRTYSWKNDIRINDAQNVSLILERLEERPTHSNNYPVSRRDTNSVAGVYRADFGRHHVQASLRNDTITGYKQKTTGGLGYQFDLTDEWSAGLNANTGFRAPTFTDLYSPWAPSPDVEPETSRNIEAHVSYQTDDMQLKATVYQNKMRNLIELDPARNYAAYNIGKATIRGLTLSGEYTLGNTTFSGSADFMDPRNDITDEVLTRRARQVYNLGLNHRIQAWDLGAEYQFVGKRFDDASENFMPVRKRLGGYSLLNLTAAYDFSKHVGVQVRWNNVFDKDYTNAYGYNTPGSSLFVNLSFRM